MMNEQEPTAARQSEQVYRLALLLDEKRLRGTVVLTNDEAREIQVALEDAALRAKMSSQGSCICVEGPCGEGPCISRAVPGGPPSEDATRLAEALLEDVYRNLREPCTLVDARVARVVVAHHLNEIKKNRVRAAALPGGPDPEVQEANCESRFRGGHQCNKAAGHEGPHENRYQRLRWKAQTGGPDPTKQEESR